VEISRGAAAIVRDVRSRGLEAIAEYATRFEARGREEPLFLNRAALEGALAEAPSEALERLERITGRIRRFAEAQRACLTDLALEVHGARAGHTFSPVKRAGCYAPGGRYPLPSSVLMTVVPARVAGVESIWLATPKPRPIMLWAAAVAGADGVLATGGAQGIAGLAVGVGPLPASDVIAGPGSLWVTAAKRFVAGTVGVDLPAGPSELLVIGDSTADAECVAADLLAQAEHDEAALPILLTTEEDLLERVEEALARQLSDLPTAATARVALANGGGVVCRDEAELVSLANAVAPEHLQLVVQDPQRLAGRLTAYGALFVGERAAEVFGDYGMGPNHVLPTGGTARYSGGLSVLTYLRMRTWLEAPTDASLTREVVGDTVWLARQEGLEAHARAAELRREP